MWNACVFNWTQMATDKEMAGLNNIIFQEGKKIFPHFQGNISWN
jgi:hypothetical protein